MNPTQMHQYFGGMFVRCGHEMLAESGGNEKRQTFADLCVISVYVIVISSV